MNLIYKIFGWPLGFIMWAIYLVVPNYAIALFIFTLITRVFLFPLAIKQQKSTAKMTMIQPRIREIQEKYKDNREKQNEEMSKLYQQEGYNPMSGCLPLLIQFPILFGLIDVVYNPLNHILRLSTGVIETIKSVFSLGFSADQLKSLGMTEQLKMVSDVQSNQAFYLPFLGAENVEKITSLNYNFLGIDLMMVPQWSMLTGIFSGGFNPVVLIPILSGLTSLAMAIISSRNAAQPAGDQQSAGMMKGMTFIMPIMSFWIAFSVPAGVGLYWTYSNIFALLQSLYMNKKYNPKELAAKAKAEFEEKKKQEMLARKEAKKKVKAGLATDEEKQKALSQKEKDKRRLAEARKRDAEKYGDTYKDE